MAQRFHAGNLRLRSPAFDHHDRIPERHAKAGENVAPPLEWEGLPEGTRSVAIVCRDYFWIYALDREHDLEPGLDRRELLERIEDSVLEQARLVGTFHTED